MQKPKVPKQELGVKINVPKPELGNEKKDSYSAGALLRVALNWGGHIGPPLQQNLHTGSQAGAWEREKNPPLPSPFSWFPGEPRPMNYYLAKLFMRMFAKVQGPQAGAWGENWRSQAGAWEREIGQSSR
jgi:hypothetical protein